VSSVAVAAAMMNGYDGRVRKKWHMTPMVMAVPLLHRLHTLYRSQHVFEGEGIRGLGLTKKTASTASLFGLTIRLFCHCGGCCHLLNNLRSSCIIVIIAADYD
jgi:hypothetical protein